MEVMECISAGPFGGHDLSETDDTPMPLRIKKKREPEYPDHYWTPRSTTIATSPTLQNSRAVPARQSSLPRSNTQIGFLLENTAASSAQRSNEMHPLHIRKQRSTNIVTSAHPGETYPRATTPPTDLGGDGRLLNENAVPELSKTLKENHVPFRVDKAPHRAITTGVMHSPELSSPFNDGPLISSARTSLITRSRSYETVRQGSKRDVIKQDDDDQSANQRVSRRISLRERFLSRVMNGLTSRQNSSNEPIEHNELLKEHEEMIQKYRDESTTKPRDEVASEHGDENSGERSGRSSHNRASATATVMSSLYSNALVDSILDNTLSAFPAPPTITTVTTPTTYPSLTPAIEMQASFQAYQGVAIVGADINAVTETTYLEPDDGDSVFVAVEIKGVLHGPEDGSSPQNHGLDVAVVIDNSLFTSPATLMASCEGTRCLATLLNMPNDRLAVLCTSPGFCNPQSGIVYPLNSVNARRVKFAVDNIIGSTDQTSHEAISATIERARGLLASATSVQNQDSLGTFGQLFVFTANPSGLPPELLYQGVHVHVVCPGTVPWKGQRNVECNGWKMRSSCRSVPEFVENTKLSDITALSTLFRTAISRARGGQIPGELFDLVLEISPGFDCSIEGVIGEKTYPSLRPGEIITALVKVKVGALQKYGSFSSLNENSNPPLDPYDLSDELDLMLGAAATTVLIAKLTYKHSLFPSRTELSISSYCQVKHELYETKGAKDATAIQNAVWVQKRLIFHLATHYSPAEAMASLIGHFGADIRRSVCPNYLKLVMEELKYQSRVLLRLESSDVDSIFASDDKSVYEHFGEGLFDIENFKPVEWMPEAPNDPQEAMQAEAWNRALDLEIVPAYDTVLEGQWLANNTHQPPVSAAPKRPEKAGMQATAETDDGSSESQSTVVGTRSRYTLDPPITRRATKKFRDVLRETIKENRPIRDGNDQIDPTSPLTPRAHKAPRQPPVAPPPQQSTARKMPTTGQKNMHQPQLHPRPMGRPTLYAGGMGGPPRPPPEYPKVIVAKNQQERLRLMAEYDEKEKRALEEGQHVRFATVGGAAGAGPSGTKGKGQGGGILGKFGLSRR